MEALQRHLLNSGVDESVLKDKIVPQLYVKGFRKIADFEYLEKKDLDELDINEVTQRRLWKLVHGDQSIFIKSDASDEVELDSEIYIRYIYCSHELFANDITEMKLEGIKPSMKLNDIVQMICTENKIPPKETIELYSIHGYPLQNNGITGQGTLKSWGIGDGDLFHVMRRPEEQPGMKEFVSLPELDNSIGQETFTIETPFHGSFPVNAYKDSDSPEDIAQKVYSVTGLQVPFMSLYVRRGYTHERMTAFTELEDRDHIRVVLRNPLEIVQPRSSAYGCRSYNFLVPQTEPGVTKFFSILKFICSPQPYNKKYDFEKFLSLLLTMTDFPPLVYAVRSLREFSFLTISGWTALIEGFYLLFKTILDTFAQVSQDHIFEYSDYIMSILIRMSHDIEDTLKVETDYCSLICPISGTRIHCPVRINVDMMQGPFDKENILSKIEDKKQEPSDNDNIISKNEDTKQEPSDTEKILSKNEDVDTKQEPSDKENILLKNEGGNDFTQYGTVKLTKEHLKKDLDTAKLLMYFPWETDTKVCVWTNPPKDVIPKVCKKVDVPFKWFDMLKSLPELFIINPQGLYSGDECLTYNSEAHLIYFLGSKKSTDKNRRFYNACASADSDYQQEISKSELERIGKLSLDLQITSDIKKVMNKSEEIPNYNEIRKAAVLPPKSSIQWEEEEAIVVLFDQSGSMENDVFPEMGEMMRIDAAKQLFSSFATRTQAYKLHHALGLTIFGSEVTIKLKLTKDTENFETKVEEVDIKGTTELTAAVVNAVEQLKEFNCRRRILCLTDGYNSSYVPYETALQCSKDANVIVDTVLLTFPDDNEEQKAFSHATGGVCVRPTSMQEALRYFELDAMLSLNERVRSQQISSNVLSDFEDMSLFPYETETSFKSTYIEAFHTVKTHSIKSHIDKVQQTPDISQQRRILKELREFLSHPMHPSIKVYPSQTEFQKWKVLMSAPKESAYSGGVFALSVEFPKKYPLSPPQIRFLTPIYHCNISGSSGRICHAILGETYTPSTSMREILCYIYGLLMCPDMDTPLDSALAGEYGYQSGREEGHAKYFKAASKYFKKAENDVKLHASKPFDALNKKYSG